MPPPPLILTHRDDLLRAGRVQLEVAGLVGVGQQAEREAKRQVGRHWLGGNKKRKIGDAARVLDDLFNSRASWSGESTGGRRARHGRALFRAAKGKKRK